MFELFENERTKTIHSSIVHSSLKKFNRKIVDLIKSRIQAVDSSFCGILSMYFACIFDIKRMPHIHSQAPFSKINLQDNDKICVNNLIKLIEIN